MWMTPTTERVLGAIETAAVRHGEAKRFDMPGFHPNDHFLIQLQRYGALPDDCDLEKPSISARPSERIGRSMWYRVER
jgi:hypothetical protein